VLQMWWPGDEGGPATAKVLLGQANPGGRLPFTWAKRLEDTPAGDPAFPERSATGVNGRTTFSEGVLVGYRWFDHQNIEPQFPFGFGLSYTTFAYAGLRATDSSDGGFDISVNLRNTGAVAGDEVAQVYLDKPAHTAPGIQFADRILAGFDRVHLAPGESKQVVIHVAPRRLQYWSTAQHDWITPAGVRTFSVGGSSRDSRLKGRVIVRPNVSATQKKATT